MRYILSVALLCMVFGHVEGIRAQQTKDSTLSRTVIVENQYNPEVMDAFKVNVLNYMPVGQESSSQRFILGEGSIGISSTFRSVDPIMHGR